MVGDGPIRISEHEWIIIRSNPRFPAALIRRIDPGGPTEHYRVVSFDLDASKRRLLGRYLSLEAANDSVRYVVDDSAQVSNFGMYENRPSAR